MQLNIWDTVLKRNVEKVLKSCSELRNMLKALEIKKRRIIEMLNNISSTRGH